MEPLEEPSAGGGDVIDRLTKESTELMKAVVATDAEEEDEDDATKAHADLEEILAALGEELNSQQSGEVGEEDVEVVEEVIVVEVDEDSPWWIETMFGPWASRHQRALRVWLVILLAMYVSLFVLVLVQHGVRGLSELSAMAMTRDLLWVVLMGIIILLAIGKRY